jgi:hypothetical protein
VVASATKKGLRPSAIPDITARAWTVFKLVQGVPVPHEADGQTVRVGKDAQNYEVRIEKQSGQSAE